MTPDDDDLRDLRTLDAEGSAGDSVAAWKSVLEHVRQVDAREELPRDLRSRILSSTTQRPRRSAWWVTAWTVSGLAGAAALFVITFEGPPAEQAPLLAAAPTDEGANESLEESDQLPVAGQVAPLEEAELADRKVEPTEQEVRKETGENDAVRSRAAAPARRKKEPTQAPRRSATMSSELAPTADAREPAPSAPSVGALDASGNASSPRASSGAGAASSRMALEDAFAGDASKAEERATNRAMKPRSGLAKELMELDDFLVEGNLEEAAAAARRLLARTDMPEPRASVWVRVAEIERQRGSCPLAVKAANEGLLAPTEAERGRARAVLTSCDVRPAAPPSSSKDGSASD
ncbi:MAG: hypothetical protein HC923_08625 [Myxococcales bacterium]|nr:hypothetical protein [Myxococcales bacterium]